MLIFPACATPQVYAPPIVTAFTLGERTSSGVTVHVTLTKKGSVTCGVVRRGTPALTVAQLRSKPADGDDKATIIEVLETIECNSMEECPLALSHLAPDTDYDLYVYAEHPLGANGSPSGSDDEAVRASRIQVTTMAEPEEDLEIAWSALTNEMRQAEILAAIKDRRVKEAAAEAEIILPCADDAKGLNAISRDKWKSFSQWWEFETDVRRNFLLREVRSGVCRRVIVFHLSHAMRKRTPGEGRKMVSRVLNPNLPSLSLNLSTHSSLCRSHMFF